MTAWYVARAGGIVAFALLTASVVVGLLLSGRPASKRWPKFALEDVHRFLGILTGIFIGVHALGLLVDNYLPFSISDLVIPGSAPYRPLATAFGVVAAELLGALAITNHYRRRIPHALWRKAHRLNFAVWLLALVHGIFAGTDTGSVWAVSLYSLSAATVAGLTFLRVERARTPKPAVPARRHGLEPL
jgi:sulfoxide reductase heme-binding subunit YedZ